MYANRSDVNDREHKVRVNALIDDRIKRVASMYKKQPATMLREFIAERLEEEEARLNAIPKH